MIAAAPLVAVYLRFEVPSQNVTERRHWRQRVKERQYLDLVLRAALPGGGCPHRGQRRRVEIVAYRKRRVADNANLVGGCKTLIDALVAAGLLVDDSERWCRISYDQALYRRAGYRWPCTSVRIFAVPA